MPPGPQPGGYGAGAATATYQDQPQHAYQDMPQPAAQNAGRGTSPVLGWVLVIAAAAVLVVTGGINAASGPLGYFSDKNIGVLILGGDQLFLAVAQTVLGLAWVAAGVLVLLGRRFGWGLALVAAGVFATYESYFVVRGAVIHYVGLFLAIAVFALLHQDVVRRHCKVGPPSR